VRLIFDGKKDGPVKTAYQFNVTEETAGIIAKFIAQRGSRGLAIRQRDISGDHVSRNELTGSAPADRPYGAIAMDADKIPVESRIVQPIKGGHLEFEMHLCAHARSSMRASWRLFELPCKNAAWESWESGVSLDDLVQQPIQ
jgi:hypothetical protein